MSGLRVFTLMRLFCSTMKGCFVFLSVFVSEIEKVESLSDLSYHHHLFTGCFYLDPMDRS
jgi:hypothetical protein